MDYGRYSDAVVQLDRAIELSRERQAELKPGKYVYSCPLNPTPDYKLEVSAG